MTAIAADGRGPQKVPCSICGEPGDPAQRFCGQCGSASSHKCAACGEENPPEFRFCGACGAPCESDGSSTPGLVNAGAGTTESEDGERRWGMIGVSIKGGYFVCCA
jgi:hypothetical protein